MRALLAAVALTIPALAQASLPVGAAAPDFTTQGAIGGKLFSFKLSKARTTADQTPCLPRLATRRPNPRLKTLLQKPSVFERRRR